MIKSKSYLLQRVVVIVRLVFKLITIIITTTKKVNRMSWVYKNVYNLLTYV